MFAGCSKDETADLAPSATPTNTSQIVRGSEMVGTYTVLKYTTESGDYTDMMKDLRIYIYKGGSMETVLNGEHAKGTYKYDPFSHTMTMNISGNRPTNVLSSREWNVTRREDRQVRLFSSEGNVSLVLYLNYPSKANPL